MSSAKKKPAKRAGARARKPAKAAPRARRPAAAARAGANGAASRPAPADSILLEVRDGIATITLNRPDKLNAINAEMRASLFEAFEDVERNPDVWVAIITGLSLIHI